MSAPRPKSPRRLAQSNSVRDLKFAYISDQTLPVRKANSVQLMNTVSALADEGLDIELIVPRRWRTLLASNSRLKRELLDFYSLDNGFKLRALLHLPLSPFKLDKITHGLIGPLRALISKTDVIYTRNSLPAFLALRMGKHVIFEVYRIYETATKDGALKLARITQTTDALSIITHSLPSRESLLAAGADADKVRVIHNGFNPAPLTPEISKEEARRELGWKMGEKIISFAGRIDVNKGANTILELAARTPDLSYVLIGYSENDNEGWVLRESKARGLANIKKLPWVPIGELAKFLFASDVLLIPPSAGPMMTYGNTVLPIKTFIYMAAGRCILAPALPDIRTVLNERNAALVPPDDLDTSTATLRKIFENREWAGQLARQAQRDSELYTWRSRARKIIAFMEERLCRL